jgi:hypothetical protein
MGVSGQRHAWPRFTPGERTPGTHCTGGWVGPRAGLDTEATGRILFASVYWYIGKCRYEIQEHKEVPVWYTGKFLALFKKYLTDHNIIFFYGSRRKNQ